MHAAGIDRPEACNFSISRNFATICSVVYRLAAAIRRLHIHSHSFEQPRTTWTEKWGAGQGDSLHAAYVVMLVLGLRRGELLGLGWEDVDLEKGEARIRWQIQRLDGQLVRRRTKTAGSDALLPLPDICVDALRSHRSMTNRRRLKAGEAWHETGLVFTTMFGLPLDPRNFNRSFRARSEAAGVPIIPVHSTRRTCASLLVELGVHPRVAMAIMRHSQISVTMNIYSQVSSESARAALADLGSTLAEGGHG